MTTIKELTVRVETLEKTNVAYDLLLTALNKADTETAQSVERLAGVINDPKVGLIVTLDRFRADSRAERRILIAFAAGLVFFINVVSPYVPTIVKLLFHTP